MRANYRAIAFAFICDTIIQNWTVLIIRCKSKEVNRQCILQKSNNITYHHIHNKYYKLIL